MGTTSIRLRAVGGFTVVARAASVWAILVGGLVLVVGWKLGVTALQRIVPGTTAMVPQTGATLILAGLALWLVGTMPAPRRAFWIGEACAALVAISGLTPLAEDAFGWRLGVTETIGRLVATSARAGPGMRPSPETALGFLLLGLALVALDVHSVLSEILTVTASGMALTALVGYLYRVPAFAGVPSLVPFTGMAVHTAVTDLVLCLGILAARPERGLVRLLTSASLGGVMARRLLPVAMVLPLLLGLLVRIGEQVGLFPDGFEEAVLAVTSVILLALVTAATAGSLDRADQARQHALVMERSLRQRLEAILETAPAGIVVVEAQTDRVDANPAAARIMGQPLVSEAGRSQYARQILVPTGQSLSFAALPTSRALRGETVQDEELFVVQPSGQRVPVRADAAPIRDAPGTVTGAVVIFQDITVQKELEREREEWTSVIAHDLRQPVTLILGYADLLARRLRESGETENERVADHICTAARNLNRMVADLLDVSRIEAHRLALSCESVELRSLVSDVVARLAEVTAGHPVQVEMAGEPLWVSADPGRIEQVLGNLLTNAAKYSFPASPISVTVNRHDDSAQVAVTNQGPGIPPDEGLKLFTRFYRTREAGKAPGLGLGLYIAKRLVETHGGQIWAESVPGETTTFRFTLPLAVTDRTPPSGVHEE